VLFPKCKIILYDYDYDYKTFCVFKGIVSRDFVVCFLVSFDRSDIYTHQERVLMLLKVRFRIEFFDSVSGHSELNL
jgi:hypothetical protein